MIVLVGAAALLDRFDLTDDEALRVDAVDARGHHEVADHDVGDFRHVVQAQPIVAAADHHALRPRALDQRAGRGVAIDEQLHLRGARARHHDAADHAGRRDHRHVGPHARRCVPLSIVSVRKSGVAPAAMISAATVSQLRPVAQVEQPLEAARAIGERALLLQRDLRRCRADASSSSFSLCTSRSPT